MLARKLMAGGGAAFHEYEEVLTSSGTWTVPYTQMYEIHVVGSGGNGGNGATGFHYMFESRRAYYTGGSGGGGGSGAYTAGRYRLRKGTPIPIVIGDSSFGSIGDVFHMQVGAGKKGGDGTQSSSVSSTGEAGAKGVGGTVAVAGNLISIPGNGGTNGNGYKKDATDWNVSTPGGTGGASVYEGYGAGGNGGHGTYSKNSTNTGSAGGSGAIIIKAIKA